MAGIRRHSVFVLFFLLGSTVWADPKELESKITKTLNQIEEFNVIKAEADRMGVRVWLLGGSAATVADFAKRKSDGPKTKHFVDQVFHASQDIDIVIDGTPAQATAFEEFLQSRTPVYRGDRSAWEVRLLKESRGPKEAIIGNPNFLNQNNDSFSGAMVEITRPHKNEPRVRDIHRWNESDSLFLKDLENGSIRYLESNSHGSTYRAINGLNPPVLSALRYLIKLSQFQLTPDPRDLERVVQIIKDTNPEQLKHPYVINWLKRNLPKIIQQSRDIEYASEIAKKANILDLLVRSQISSSTPEATNLLRRAPLPSFSVGAGSGRTARELKIDKVSHVTTDIEIMDAMTRNPSGIPNVFMSRRGQPGENAIYGDGFYTSPGEIGWTDRGNVNVQFELLPNAREGSDFEIHYNQQVPIVLVKNRSALRVLPNTTDLNPAKVIQALGQVRDDKGGRAYADALELRMLADLRRRPVMISSVDLAHIRQILDWAIRNPTDFRSKRMLKIFFSTTPVPLHDTYLNHLLSTPETELRSLFDKMDLVAELVLNHRQWFSDTRIRDLTQRVLKTPAGAVRVAEHVLSKPSMASSPFGPALFIQAIKTGNAAHELRQRLGSSEWASHQQGGEILRAFFKVHKPEYNLDYIFEASEWAESVEGSEIFLEQISRLIKKGERYHISDLVNRLLGRSHWAERADMFSKVLPGIITLAETDGINNDYLPGHVDKTLYRDKRWSQVLEPLLRKGFEDLSKEENLPLIAGWFGIPDLPDQFEKLKELSKNPELDFFLIERVFTRERWFNDPESQKLFREIIERNPRMLSKTERIIKKPWFRKSPLAAWLLERSVLSKPLRETTWDEIYNNNKEWREGENIPHFMNALIKRAVEKKNLEMAEKALTMMYHDLTKFPDAKKWIESILRFPDPKGELTESIEDRFFDRKEIWSRFITTFTGKSVKDIASLRSFFGIPPTKCKKAIETLADGLPN